MSYEYYLHESSQRTYKDGMPENKDMPMKRRFPRYRELKGFLTFKKSRKAGIGCTPTARRAILPHRRMGKLVFAQDASESEALDEIDESALGAAVTDLRRLNRISCSGLRSGDTHLQE